MCACTIVDVLLCRIYFCARRLKTLRMRGSARPCRRAHVNERTPARATERPRLYTNKAECVSVKQKYTEQIKGYVTTA